MNHIISNKYMLALCRIRLHHVYMDRRYLTVNDLSVYLGIKPKTSTLGQGDPPL
jgi:hypothetical protein